MWVMDRGIPTEQILPEDRDPARAIFYLIGTPERPDTASRKEVVDLP